MKKIMLVPLISMALLFIGCGESDSSSGSSTFKISSGVSLYSVVKGMKKDIVLKSNRDNVTFVFVDKSEAPITELDGSVITYRAPLEVDGTDQKIVVKAIDENGKDSNSLILTFHTVSDNIAPNIDILKTGIDDGGIGKDRNFALNDDGNVIDPFGNVWENRLDDKAQTAQIYLLANNRCEVKRLIDKNSNWRVPTVDEYLNLINYSKVAGSSMLDDVFDNTNLTSWVESVDDQYLVVSQSTGLTSKVNFYDKYPVRCINAPKRDINHVVSTEERNLRVTYDFSTGLKWSPMSADSFRKIQDDVNQTAAEYCAQYDNASGWRLPSINEIRSVVENGSISTNIMKNYTMVVTSTPYNNSDSAAKLAHYVIGLDQDKKVFYAVSYADILYPITCVKEI